MDACPDCCLPSKGEGPTHVPRNARTVQRAPRIRRSAAAERDGYREKLPRGGEVSDVCQRDYSGGTIALEKKRRERKVVISK